MKITFDREFSASLKKLAVPIMLQSLLSTAIGTADPLMLSVVGQTELSAVSLANQWSFILNLFFTGLVGGTGIMIAQYMESRNKEQLPHVFGMALWAADGDCSGGGSRRLYPDAADSVAGYQCAESYGRSQTVSGGDVLYSGRQCYFRGHHLLYALRRLCGRR